MATYEVTITSASGQAETETIEGAKDYVFESNAEMVTFREKNTALPMASFPWKQVQAIRKTGD